jgi:hypothetical protein
MYRARVDRVVQCSFINRVDIVSEQYQENVKVATLSHLVFSPGRWNEKGKLKLKKRRKNLRKKKRSRAGWFWTISQKKKKKEK